MNIENWLDRCSYDEPDSMIYDPEYCNEVASTRCKLKTPEIENLYKVVADMCTKIGLPSETVEERLGDIDECISTFLATIQKDVQEEFDKLCQYKQELLDQIQKMLSDLYLPAHIPDENITLLQHCKRLKTKFNELNVVREKRLTRWQELREKQTWLCIVLGIKTPTNKTKTDIPTEDELKELSRFVVDLEREEANRKKTYAELMDFLSSYMDQLEYIPQNKFEENILTEKPCYTESHLREMTKLKDKLKEVDASNRKRFEKLKSRLESLYERLDVDREEREEFLNSHSTCKPSLLAEMDLEIERYEELKKQNIGRFVQKTKQELEAEYDWCYVPEENRDGCLKLSTDPSECTEDLLEIFETALERAKKYREENKAVLEKFKSWSEMFDQLKELEENSNNPERLNNRGGQLLKEEKKRNRLKKGFEKLERELRALNVDRKFKIYDLDLDEHIKRMWDDFSRKEREKRDRQRAGVMASKSRNATQLQGGIRKTPVKRPAAVGMTPTPSKIQCQRSAFGTPSNARSNMTGMSGSVKKSVQKNLFNPQDSNMTTRAQLSSNGKSNIPVHNYRAQVTHRDKTAESVWSDCAPSLSEEDFEKEALSCPASARKYR